MRRLVVAAILVLVCAACQPLPPRLKPVLAGEGEAFLYLEPFSPEERVMGFALAGISVVKGDGTEVPLTLRLSELKPGSPSRQRLLASGVLPAGSYRGFTCRAARASLKTDEGELPLTVSDKPEKIDFPFEVKGGRAIVLASALRYRDAVKERTLFRPEFSFAIPGKPLTLLTGYVTNSGSNTVAVFDKRAGAVRDVIETGQGPKGIVLDQKQLKAYVAISGDDCIEVIDLLSNEVVNRIRLTPGDRPGEIVLTPDGKTLITANTGSNSVSFVDPSTLLETSRLTLLGSSMGSQLGNQPGSLLLDPTGTKLYVFNYLSNNISLIDIASKTVTATIPTEPAPLRGTFNRKGDQLIVYYGWSPYILVIDPVSLAILRRVNAGMGISSIKVDKVTDFTYVGKSHRDKVDIYAPFLLFPSDFSSDFLRGSGGPTYMLIDGDTNNLLLVLPDQNALQTINLVTKKEESLIDVGDEPFWATIMGERQ